MIIISIVVIDSLACSLGALSSGLECMKRSSASIESHSTCIHATKSICVHANYFGYDTRMLHALIV